MDYGCDNIEQIEHVDEEVAWNILFIYATAEGQCNGSTLILHATEVPTNLETPNYPNGYDSDLDCTWILDSGSDGQKIMLFSDSVDVVCNDYFAIIDGNSSEYSFLQNPACGAIGETGIYVTSGRYAMLVFLTDNSTFGNGMTFTYLSARDTSGTGCLETMSLVATVTPQYLTSPDFPYYYPPDSRCRWEISGSTASSTVYAEVMFMEVEEDETCEYDYFSIHDGLYICEYNEIMTMCPTRTNAEDPRLNFTSTDNAVIIKLFSDYSVERHGFLLKYVEILSETTATTNAPTTTETRSSTTGATTTCGRDIPVVAGSAAAGAALGAGVVGAIWLIRRLCLRNALPSYVTKVQPFSPGR
ncbi:deleted in malignant brain tumors 1 protein-like [Mya arenaria]|uniref:deleted in malignant brain tumors 1 protein-like n=1 Tax=Mya arenaria TaxID=6604 RepID=UPI0022E07799|nr:deleted in malignant brain tumors 1 protein-like [Mya arenaria]